MTPRSYIGHARRPIEEYELADLLSVTPPRPRLYWLLAADSGLRRSEIVQASTNEIHGDRIRVLGKGEKVRWTILTSRTLDLLHALRISGRICHLTYGSLYERFKWDRLKAHIPPDICLHSLRHRFATQLLRAAVNLIDIQDLLGHTSLTTTALYLHSDPRRFTLARQALEVGELPERSTDLTSPRDTPISRRSSRVFSSNPTDSAAFCHPSTLSTAPIGVHLLLDPAAGSGRRRPDHTVDLGVRSRPWTRPQRPPLDHSVTPPRPRRRPPIDLPISDRTDLSTASVDNSVHNWMITPQGDEDPPLIIPPSTGYQQVINHLMLTSESEFPSYQQYQQAYHNYKGNLGPQYWYRIPC